MAKAQPAAGALLRWFLEYGENLAPARAVHKQHEN